MFHFGSLAPPRGSLGYPGPGAGGTKGNPSTLPVPFRSLWKGLFSFIYEIFAQDASRRTSGNEGNFPRFPRFPEVVGVNVALQQKASIQGIFSRDTTSTVGVQATADRENILETW